MFQGTPLSADTVQHLREKRPEAFRTVVTPELLEGLAPQPAAGTVLHPEVVFWLMAYVALGEGTMASVMTTYWASLAQQFAAVVPLEPLTPAAFCTARRNLALDFFAGVFSRLIDRFDKQFSGRYRWKGFRLVSTDGSLLNLPAGAKKLLEVYCPSANEQGAGKHPQALLVGLVDVWSGLCRDFQLVSPKVGEIAAVSAAISMLQVDHLLLGDRNFSCFEVMARVLQQRGNFLFRLQTGWFTGTSYERRMLGVNEWLTTLHVTEACRKIWPEAPAEIVVRIIYYQLPGRLPSYLITSLLDPKLYPWEDLVMLYHERWRQETSHNDWKHTLTLSNLRSKTEIQIRKEVLVQLTLNNAVRWTMAEAAALADRQGRTPVHEHPSPEPVSSCVEISHHGDVSAGLARPDSIEEHSVETGLEASAPQIDEPSEAVEKPASIVLQSQGALIVERACEERIALPSRPSQEATPEQVSRLLEDKPTCAPPATVQLPPSKARASEPGKARVPPPPSRKRSPVRPVELRFLHTKRLVIAASARMAGANPADVPRLYRQLLHEIARTPILVRRGRHHDRRKNEALGRNKGHGKIARSSRIPRQPGDENNPGFIDIDKRPFMTPDACPMTI